MSTYIPFTDEEKLLAATADLPSFLAKQGIELKRSGNEYRIAADPYITIRGNQWYDQAEQRGGNAVSFVRRYFNRSYPDAVTMLLGGEVAPIDALGRPKEKKPFALPPRHTNTRRVYAYLIQQRCIPAVIISHFAKTGMLYESAEKSKDGRSVYHNVVFVGQDETGVARHAHKHGLNSTGPSYKGNVEGSNPAHSFHHIGASGRLYVFEAPIDMLSFIALHPTDWQQHSHVALCGVAEHAMLQCLAANPHISQVVLCLDNDQRGQEGAARLRSILSEKGCADVETLLPCMKDWNDDQKNAVDQHINVPAAIEAEPILSNGMQFL